MLRILPPSGEVGAGMGAYVSMDKFICGSPAPMLSQQLSLATLAILIMYLQQLQQGMSQLQRDITQVTAVLGCLCAAVEEMRSIHGMRRLLGAPHVHNRGQYEAVQEMMESNPTQFQRLFRMNVETFNWFEQTLWEHVHGLDDDMVLRRGRRPDRHVFKRRLLQTIDFLASGCTLEHLSFTWGKTIDWKELLIEEIASMIHIFVRWPLGQAMRDTCAAFERMRGFKGCCGCIDGTFVKIKAPWTQSNNPGDYNTYKKYYAIQILAVCTASMLFTFVHTGAPGSRADSWILHQTSLWKHWDQFFPKAHDFNGYAPFYYIFGDSGFKLMRWLMIPFTRKQEQAPLDARQKKQRRLYSADQKSTRAVVETAFGVLKGRWRCLHVGLQCVLGHSSTLVQACIVLHNVCIMQADIWQDYNPNDNADPDTGLDEPAWLGVDLSKPPPAVRSVQVEDNQAKQVRDLLAQTRRSDMRPH